MTYTELDRLTQEYRLKEQQIWRDTEFKLYQKYLKEGYTMWFAEVMAHQEVLELKSMPRTSASMPPKGKFHYLPNESLD